MFVAGYPNHPGIGLFVEVRTNSNKVRRIPISVKADPGTEWQLVNISLTGTTSPKEFRIVVNDHSTVWGGWVGVSAPFVANPLTSNLIHQLILVILASAASIIFFLSPGLLLRHIVLSTRARLIGFIWLPIPGLFTLILLGLFVWMGPHQLKPSLISRIGLFLLISFVIFQIGRIPLAAYTSPLERKALLVLIVLVVIAVSKSTYSLGPARELYRGMISRTLEVGDRSDSRISYCTAEIVALRSRPYSSFAWTMLEPWNFSDRGPLAALATTPLVLAGPTKIPGTVPTQPWLIYDPEGFAAYRIGMIVMACCGLLITFGFTKWIIPEDWAFWAYLIVGTAPFAIHEIYFTWPKLIAASFVFLAAYLILRSRYFLAGFFLGIGYLFHPSVLLATPTLLGLIALLPIFPRLREMLTLETIFKWTKRTAAMFFGLGIWIIAWRMINRKHFDQGGFVLFFLQADRQVATLGNWLLDRLNSLLNSLVPLNLFLFHREEYFVNAVEAPSPPIVEFFFQPWTGVPFGGGIVFFFCLIRIAFLALKKARAWFILLIVIPFLFFTAYWGAASSGVLREGMHAWFLSLMVGAVIILYKFAPNNIRLFKALNISILFRGAEILLMLLLPTISTQHKLVQQQFLVSDVLSLLGMVCGTVWLTWFSFNYAERLRTSTRN